MEPQRNIPQKPTSDENAWTSRKVTCVKAYGIVYTLTKGTRSATSNISPWYYVLIPRGPKPHREKEKSNLFSKGVVSLNSKQNENIQIAVYERGQEPKHAPARGDRLI